MISHGCGCHQTLSATSRPRKESRCRCPSPSTRRRVTRVPQDHLSQGEVRAVVAYIKNFSPKFAARRSPESLPIPPSPPSTAEAVDRGRRIYRKAGCAECHGSEGRGDGPSARDLSGETDLTQRPLKSGSIPRDIFRSILTGLDGTPMPSYHLTLEDDEL